MAYYVYMLVRRRDLASDARLHASIPTKSDAFNPREKALCSPGSVISSRSLGQKLRGKGFWVPGLTLFYGD